MGRAERVARNTGQEVHGDVFAERLVFNVGEGQPRPLAEMEVGDLEDLRAKLVHAVARRRSHGAIQFGFSWFIVLFLWASLPIGLLLAKLDFGVALPFQLAVIAAATAAIWHVAFGFARPWWQRNQGVIATHLRTLKAVDAELDMRCPAAGGSTRRKGRA